MNGVSAAQHAAIVSQLSDSSPQVTLRNTSQLFAASQAPCRCPPLCVQDGGNSHFTDRLHAFAYFVCICTTHTHRYAIAQVTALIAVTDTAATGPRCDIQLSSAHYVAFGNISVNSLKSVEYRIIALTPCGTGWCLAPIEYKGLPCLTRCKSHACPAEKSCSPRKKKCSSK